MTLSHRARCATLLFVCVLAARLAAEEPAAPLAPNHPDEPLARQYSHAKASEFLDRAALSWTREKKCGSCHTNYAYMMASPFTGGRDRPAGQEIRRFFETRATGWDTNKPRWDAEVIATAVTLAYQDAHTTGKLHAATRVALDRMWKLQQANGAWNWLKCGWPPAEDDDYYGAVWAAIGVGAAPEGYAQGDAARDGVRKLMEYLKATPAPSLHHRVLLLWASSYWKDLLNAADRDRIIGDLSRLQRADGGWSLPSLAPEWKRKDGSANDAAGAPSDGYATGLVLFALRRAGVPADDPRLARGIDWLKKNQRESGRWFTRSTNNDKYHYITHVGSAYAVMAIHACETNAVAAR